MNEARTTEEEMSFTEHLGELRDRLIRVAGALLFGFMVAFAYRDPIFQFLSAPMHEALADYGVYTFRAIEITETIFVYLKMSVVAGILLTLPITFYQLWAFIAPGLLEKERQAIMPLLFFSTFFFLLGAYFAFEVIIPFIARYLAELTLAADTVQMDVTVASAFGFSLKLILAFGIAFELPLVMFFLSVLGLVEPAKYIKFYRFFILISFVVGALLTPPDPISQLLMAAPLNLLYWVGVGASMFAQRREKSKRVRLQSRVWVFLSMALFSIGGILAASTWYLGRTDSPLRHIPNDALWVTSIRLDKTLGQEASKRHQKALRDVLDLPASISLSNQVVVAKGPVGEPMIIIATACENEQPMLGDCFGDDLIVGGDEWLEAPRQDERTLEETSSITTLALSAPTFAWSRAPDPDVVNLLPGHALLRPKLSRASIAIDLRRTADNVKGPYIDLRLTPAENSVLTAMQNRVDLWRSDQVRQIEQAQRDQRTTEREQQLIQLLKDVISLEEERFRLQASSLNKKDVKLLEKKSAALQARLTNTVGQAQPVAPKAKSGHSLVETLSNSLEEWTTLVDDDALALEIKLQGPSLVEDVVSSLLEYHTAQDE